MTEVNGLGAGVANGCAEGGKLSPATQRLVEEWLELDRVRVRGGCWWVSLFVDIRL